MQVRTTKSPPPPLGRVITRRFATEDVGACVVCLAGPVAGSGLGGGAIEAVDPSDVLGILSADERVVLSRMSHAGRRRAAWWYGRAAAKTAVGHLVGETRCPSAITIGNDPDGAPRVTSGGDDALVSIAHKSSGAIAAAGRRGPLAGIGVDLEPLVDRFDQGVIEFACGPDERRLIAEAADAGPRPLDLWCTFAWCAKEAAGKALGTGLRGGLRRFRIAAIDVTRLRMTIAAGDGRLQVLCAVERGHALALCTVPGPSLA